MNSTTHKITTGEMAGLVIKMMPVERLRGMVAVQISHDDIIGFEARALLSAGTSLQEVYTAVKRDVRLIGAV